MALTFAPPAGVMCAANISPDGVYRFSLDRRWGDGPTVLWILLNPSAADANVDDQTIGTITRLTRRWSRSHDDEETSPEWWARFGGLRVVNLSPFRCTKPRDLLGKPEVIESMLSNVNITTIAASIGTAGLVVGGWGDGPSNMAFREKMRGPVVVIQQMLREVGKKMWCVDVTGERNPRHPLYSPNDRVPMEWPGYYAETPAAG